MNFLKMREKLLAKLESGAPAELIQVRIESAASLFDPLDSSPPAEKNLNGQLESYLLDAIGLIKVTMPVKIRVVVPEDSGQTENVRSVITRHFRRKAEKNIAANARRFKFWRFNLFVGLLFLAVCLAVGRFFALPVFAGHQLFSTIGESFAIIGWVALWEPTSFILYGWREKSLDVISCIRLSLAEIEFVRQPSAGAGDFPAGADM